MDLDWIGLDWTGSDQIWLDWTGLDLNRFKIGVDWSDRIGFYWKRTELNWTGPYWTSSGSIGLEWTF